MLHLTQLNIKDQVTAENLNLDPFFLSYVSLSECRSSRASHRKNVPKCDKHPFRLVSFNIDFLFLVACVE